MPTENIRQLLIQERDRLNRAIEVLQGPNLRRGRPLSPAAFPALPPRAARKRPARTAAQRKAQSERMKEFRASRKNQKSTK